MVIATTNENMSIISRDSMAAFNVDEDKVMWVMLPSDSSNRQTIRSGERLIEKLTIGLMIYFNYGTTDYMFRICHSTV